MDSHHPLRKAKSGSLSDHWLSDFLRFGYMRGKSVKLAGKLLFRIVGFYVYRVLHVLFYTGLYGAEQSLITLVKGLAERQVESVVAVYQPGPLVEVLSALDIPVVYVATMKPWLPNSSVPLIKKRLYNIYHIPFAIVSARKLQHVIKNYKINLVHTASGIIIDGALAASWAGVPHIWHIRETIEPNKSVTFWLGPEAAKWLIKKFSTRVVTNSVATQRTFISHRRDLDKVKVVYNGIDLTEYNSVDSAQAFRQQLGLPKQAKLVVMVAQLQPLKRQQDFIKAAAIVNSHETNAVFLSVGGNPAEPDEYVDELKRLVEKLSLTNKLIWLEHQTTIQRIYLAADLVVLPSEEESFGRVLIEAMAARKPVVATNVGGIPEIVVHGKTGLLVPPKRPELLAEAMLTILQDDQLAHQMGEAGRRRVEQKFTERHYIEGVINIYREALGV